MIEQNTNSLGTLLNSVSNIKLIEEVSSLVLNKVNGKISICFPKIKNQQNNIHFLIETEKKLNLFELAELTNIIKEKLGFDYTADDNESADIIVELKNFFDKDKINKLFNDITLFSKENIKNIYAFFKQNYPNFFKSQESVVTLQSNSYGSLWNVVETKEMEKTKDLDIELIEHLKSNPSLWYRLTRAPESWDRAQQEVKKEIVKASDDNNPLVSF